MERTPQEMKNILKSINILREMPALSKGQREALEKTRFEIAGILDKMERRGIK